MESAGARLKKIRQELGITLEEVHKKTKIHLNILKAIEEDSLISLNPVYIKGFLKIYCKFLGQDPQEYTAGYQTPQGQVKIIKERPYSSLKLKLFRGIKNIKIIFIIIFILFFFIGLFTLGKTISSKRSLRVKKAEPEKAQVASKKEVLSSIRLGIRAREDCWVHIKVDGRLVFRNILKKGKFESWQAKDKIELSLGNAGVIDLELNGKAIPALGRRGQVLKNIVVTKEEGLIVGR